MLLEALDHPKTLDLAARLGVELPTAIGYLELLWAFTAKKAPQGNVGKWPAGAIARACYWMGDPATFLDALTAARFLDRDLSHGLCVHDWQDHAPRWVKAKLKQARLTFVTPTVPTAVTPIGGTIVGPTVATHRVEKPSLEKPRVGKEADHPESQTAGGTAEPGISDGPDAHTLTTLIQLVYPAGTYGGQNWILAERELGKLLDGGDHAPQLIAAAQSYADQQTAAGNVGTQFIRSPERFYRDGHWRGPFPLPAPRPGKGNRVAAALATLEARIGSEDDDDGTRASA
jgi:hypothetical protein